MTPSIYPEISQPPLNWTSHDTTLMRRNMGYELLGNKSESVPSRSTVLNVSVVGGVTQGRFPDALDLYLDGGHRYQTLT